MSTMKYAVIKLNGHQYRVEENEEILVDRLDEKEGKEFEIAEVLLVVNNDKIEIGQPLVKKTKIKAKVIAHLKGEKLRVTRFRAKSRYRRVTGFRPSLTKIQIGKFASA
jgi:large subunit ribosomal protein L21